MELDWVDDERACNALDYFLFQHRLREGRTVVESFVATRPGLDEPERAMLLGWRDVVEGLFEVHRLAAANPDRARQVFQRLLNRPRFRWTRDGEPPCAATANPLRHVPLPRVVPISDRLTGQLAPPRRVRRKGQHDGH